MFLYYLSILGGGGGGGGGDFMRILRNIAKKIFILLPIKIALSSFFC